jgi:hypothetical protein
MNLLNRQHPTATFLPHEKFFLELWHGMTHELSLDSHRVRCLNARTIIWELNQELRIARMKPEEYQELCAEADEILTRDPLAAGSFARHMGLLQPLLKTPPPLPDEKKKDAAVEQKFREFRFVLADFSVALEREYFKQLVAILPDTIVAGNNQKTEAVVGALLSDLIDQGWPLETLFSWVDLFFQKKRRAQYDNFSANLRFLLQQISWGKQSYRVILRFVGSSKLADFGEFAGFQFRSQPGFTPLEGNTTASDRQRRFATVTPLTVFAETSVEAVDLTAAAITAREKFEQCLDQLRFNFEPEPLKVDERCFVERLGDNHTDIRVVRHLVPNPHHHLEPKAFREFSEEMTKLMKRSSVDAESRERLQAAIRHYRFGSDAETYKDKFLNWWMGLEFLSYVNSDGYIGRTVAAHTSDALLQRYLYRLVSDLVRTIKSQEIAWDADLAAASGVATLNDLEYPGALKLLQAQPMATKLVNSFPNNPIAALRIGRLATILQDPKKTADALAAHQRHLLWQLGRLYRIRCCIVHGSAVRFKLPLLAANMEFYLKELIIVCLRSLTLNPHVHSLREVFQRTVFARQRLDADLRVAPPNPDAVRNAVFNSVVIQENF